MREGAEGKQLLCCQQQANLDQARSTWALASGVVWQWGRGVLWKRLQCGRGYLWHGSSCTVPRFHQDRLDISRGLQWPNPRLISLGPGHLDSLLMHMINRGGGGLVPLNNFTLSSKSIEVALCQNGLHDWTIRVIIGKNKGWLQSQLEKRRTVTALSIYQAFMQLSTT